MMSGQKERVLIAEDNREYREGFRMDLEEAGYHVTTANDGEVAIHFIKRGKFDIVILDMKMPRRDGIDVLKVIEDRPSQAKVIVLSAFLPTYEEDIRKHNKVIYGCYNKPLDNIVITNLVHEAIERQKEQLQENAVVVQPILIKAGNQTLSVTDPFEIKAEDAGKISLKDYKKLFGLLRDKYKELIEEGFRKTNAMDIVLCDREVVADSNIFGGLTEDRINEIKRKKGKACYIIGRGDLIEDMGTSKWNVCPITNEDDAYPTLPIYLGGGKWDDNDVIQDKNKIIADFDTGNPLIPNGFLAFPDKLRMSLNEELGEPGESSHFGKPYCFNLKKVRIGIVDINGSSQCADFDVRFVEDDDWWVMRQTDRKRDAFVGRELLFKLLFSLTLNPKSYISTIHLPRTDNPKLQSIEKSMREKIDTIENRDSNRKGHSDRVAKYAGEIAKVLRLQEDEIEIIKYASSLHDIGMIHIQDEILLKSTKLTEEDWEQVRSHSAKGADMLKPRSLWKLWELALYIKHHHERLDGSGYPDGLEGDDIPLGSRIIAVADSFDAMMSPRAYRLAKKRSEAIEVLNNENLFDPLVVGAFKKTKAGSL